jgi:uncharacterized membrane protein
MKEFFNNTFRNRSSIVFFSWLIVIVYAAVSINLLAGWFRQPDSSPDPQGMISFAIVSFLLVILVAVYHLSSLIRRRRRRSDRQRLSRAKFVRAKHRLPPRTMK